MASGSPIVLTNGVNAPFTDNNGFLTNQTIAQVLANETLKTFLGLTGNETAEVQSGNNWLGAPSTYVLQAGNQIRFSQTNGGKGR